MSSKKLCTSCNESMPLTSFHKSKSGKFGHVARCKSCISKFCKAYYEKNHIKKFKAIQSSRVWKLNNKNKRRNDHLLFRFGITEKQYSEMMIAQGLMCSICDLKQADSKSKFHVDHDHKTGAVRGILCRSCNHGLGNFKDDYFTLGRAIEYLHRSRIILRTELK